MFSVRPLETEPANCPLCPYAPSSLRDLHLHLHSSHSSSSPLLHCAFSHCGFCYIHNSDYHLHLLHRHLLHSKAKEWQSVHSQDTDVVTRLISLTCGFLLTLEKLHTSEETREVEDGNWKLTSIIAHSREVLKTFPPQNEGWSKRSRSPSECSSHGYKARKYPCAQSTSSSPYSSESL